MSRPQFNRRQFIQQASAAFAATAPPGFSLSSQASVGSDYKALVCVFLNGGNDAWNTVAPISTAEYAAYASARGHGETWGLALDQSQFLSIDKGSKLQAEGNYGMHPSLTACHSLYQQGDLAIVSGVGPLVKPTTTEQYRAAVGIIEDPSNSNHPLPSSLFGHNTQSNQWHTLNGTQNRPYGWAGRALDALHPQLTNQGLPAGISTQGRPNLLTGEFSIPYAIDPNGIQRFEGLTEGTFHTARAAAYRRMMAATLESDTASLYQKGFAQVQASALENALKFQQALDRAPSFVSLPDGNGDGLATQLRTVAKIISAHEDFSVNRQIFFVEDTGFDTHGEQMSTQPKLLAELDNALGGFADALKSMGMWDKVVTFTQSDFGRTLTSNGDGSDHGWSGLQLVLGGAVQGGQMVGSYPTLELGTSNEIGNGNFIPDISADQYAATLANWFGVPDSALDGVCPHLANFSERHLGFLPESDSAVSRVIPRWRNGFR